MVDFDGIPSFFAWFIDYQFMHLYSYFRVEDTKDQLRKRMFTKRIVRKIMFSIPNGLSIELNAYALIRPAVPGMPLLSSSDKTSCDEN